MCLMYLLEILKALKASVFSGGPPSKAFVWDIIEIVIMIFSAPYSDS